MKTKINYLSVVLCLILSGLIFILGFNRNVLDEKPIELYEVFLHGESIGVIDNKDELYELINEEQKHLKDKYKVNNIYPPKGLELVPVNTYNKNISSIETIYNKIKDKESFTIMGYEVTIKDGNKIEKINILNEKDLKIAIDNTIKAFVKAEQLDLYRNNAQKEVTEKGTKIEDINIKEDISIKKSLISTDEKVLNNVNELSRYLLFGTLDNQETYTVMPGDTIEEIALNNNLNTSEFLIANPKIIGENALLFPGQKVNIGLIKPKISVVVQTLSTSLQEIPFDTIIEYDNKITVGTTFTKQQGVKGLNKATFRIETINGADTNAAPIKAEELKPKVDRIIVKGGLSINYAGDSEYWGWPTIRPYQITSPYGPRWGSFHRGIDIAGIWQGSPIYAIADGVVVKTFNGCPTNGNGYGDRCGQGYGNNIVIDHQNGYFSQYAHLSNGLSVSEGDRISKGQIIGKMGNSGSSTGTHLHFGIWKGGAPHTSGSYTINPLSLYK